WTTMTNRFESGRTGSYLFAARRDLFNGNIGAMVTNISQPKAYSSAVNEFPAYMPQGTAYLYDKVNRLKNVVAYTNINTTDNTWGVSGIVPANVYKNTFTYDGNGNIKKQARYNGSGTQFE